MAELLVWPALIAYGEAAVASPASCAARGWRDALAIWGVRLGWLAQTALLCSCRLLDADGFPWATWAGALNLFVWLVVAAYLIWGCRPRYRLLGLAVMPPAAALLVARVRGRRHRHRGGRPRRTAARRARRVDARGLRRAARSLRGWRRLPLAGAAAQAPRRGRCCGCACRRSRRSTGWPPGRCSSALGLLAVGIVAGLASFESGDFDAAMAVTLRSCAPRTEACSCCGTRRACTGRASRA